MKRLLLGLLVFGGLLLPSFSFADETVTVSATSADVSENLNLKTVATLFGQAKDLEEFEMMINNPDSAFSNLDLNGDGEVDYLRVVEVADGDKHLVVIQSVLAKDIYQDVASIFVEKDNQSQSITVQVIGDEYVYGTDYIIEPVYIHRPLIYDWFWGTSWVCWHSPYYWGYYPTWWRPYHCVDPFVYWDHCYWHHYHYPICSYRTGHHYHHHYHGMHHHVGRHDYATIHPERSFATRNASQNISNARSLEQNKRAVRATANVTSARTRVAVAPTATRSTATMNRTFGSTNVRSASTSTTRVANTSAATRVANTSAATRVANTSAATRVASPTRTVTSSHANTMHNNAAVRSTNVSASRSTSSPSAVRSASSSSMRSSAGTSTRSVSSSGSRTR